MKPVPLLALAAVTFLPPTPCAAVTAEYVQASTRRIAQVTGDYDPEGLAHVNNTVPWGVDGVDLGANTEHDGKLFFFFGDVPRTLHPRLELGKYPPQDADLVAYTTEAYPEPNGIHLTPALRSDGIFDPFQIRFQLGAPSIPLLTNQTPTGAFSYNGRAYVFSVRNLSPNSPNGEWVSYLASACDPARSAVLDVHFELSRGRTAKFLQVAPWVVQNAALPGLPSTNARDGLIMIGHAGLDVSLAWMPLWPGRHPKQQEIQYWRGNPVGPPPSDPALRRAWSSPWSPPNPERVPPYTYEGVAQPLFHTQYGWTSLSVGQIKETGLWILLSQKAFGPNDNENPDGPIVAHVAATPWGLAQAGEVVIFDPKRDGAFGQFMHRPGMDHPNRWPPVFPGQPKGFAYGAYLLNRYTLWNARERILTIWYLMSTFSPYQVQLMRSQIRIQ